jgi:hypothetical protein
MYRVCNVSYAAEHGYFLINPLAPVTGAQSSAPIYAYAEDAVISTIIPGDLGVPVGRSLHLHTAPITVILALAHCAYYCDPCTCTLRLLLQFLHLHTAPVTIILALLLSPSGICAQCLLL